MAIAVAMASITHTLTSDSRQDEAACHTYSTELMAIAIGGIDDADADDEAGDIVMRRSLLPTISERVPMTNHDHMLLESTP